MSKNEVEQFLAKQEIEYSSHDFLSTEELPAPIFKTLVLKGNKTGPLIALVPLEERLDYKKTRKVSGDRKVGLPPIEDVLEITGYPHGANTPIGIYLYNPEYPMFFDQTIHQYQEIIVSSGETDRGITIFVQNLIELINPVIADLLKDD